MPVAKLKASNSPELMKSEGNDSSDTIIRQAIKEPLLSFSRAGDSPVQLIQLLHALDQQGTCKLSSGSSLTASFGWVGFFFFFFFWGGAK